MFYQIILTLFFLIPLFYLRVVKKKSWSEIKQDLIPKYQGHKKEILGSFALFGALLIGFILIAMCLTLIEGNFGIPLNDMENVSTIIDAQIGTNLIGFLVLLIIVLFAEEFFFRAFLVPRIGMIFSTLIFTFFHLGYGSIAETIGVFILGLLLAYWFKKNKSLFQNYFGHLLYDFLAIALYLVF